MTTLTLATLLNKTVETEDHKPACSGTRTVYQWDSQTREGFIHLAGHVWKVVTSERGKYATLQEDMGIGWVTPTGFRWRDRVVARVITQELPTITKRTVFATPTSRIGYLETMFGPRMFFSPRLNLWYQEGMKLEDVHKIAEGE